MFERLFGKKKATKEPEKIPVDRLYADFVKGAISQQQLFHMLSPDDVSEFVTWHQSRVEELRSDPQTNRWKMNQIDSMIERGLEKLVREAQGERVVERWK